MIMLRTENCSNAAKARCALGAHQVHSADAGYAPTCRPQIWRCGVWLAPKVRPCGPDLPHHALAADVVC